jgi:hypothetical protein
MSGNLQYIITHYPKFLPENAANLTQLQVKTSKISNANEIEKQIFLDHFLNL